MKFNLKLADRPHNSKLDVAFNGDARTTVTRGISYAQEEGMVAQAEGPNSFAISDGDCVDACVMGTFCSAAIAMGYESKAATVACRHSAAIALGIGGYAKASDGCAIVLAYHAPRGGMLHVKAGIAGRNGIKPDTWYRLNHRGEFEEAK